MSAPVLVSGAPIDPSLFQYTGGLLERSFYLSRPADRALPEALLAGEYCHILAPRQIGKTSVCFRTARALQKRGVRCALVDLTAAGTPSTAEEWYFGLVDEIARRLGLPDPLDVWQRRSGVAPAQRFRDYIRGLVSADPNGPPVVVFLDEIEMVRLAPIDVDDFLLLLRSFHEERGQSPALGRLTFCLIGVTTPNDLIKNKSVTPFNVSKPIRIDDFTRAECAKLAEGLAALDANPDVLLDRVYDWTFGHPYMTMRACFELARKRTVTRGGEQAAVDEVVRELFLDRPLEDTNINYAARRFSDPKFERDGARLADKIQLYRRVLQQKDPPAHNESAVQMELRICGMVKDVEVSAGSRVLRPRNRIYERALDAEWLRSKGERRFVSEAVWKWLDANKDEAALLRGIVLEKALDWASKSALSEDEQAFLDASRKHESETLDRERVRITQEVRLAQTAQKSADDQLTKVQTALALAMADKVSLEADRERLEEQQTYLKASVRKTRFGFYFLLSGLVLTILVAALVVQKTDTNLRQMSAESEARLSDATRAQQKVDELNGEIEKLKPQASLLREKDEQLRKREGELRQKETEIQKKDDDLRQLDDLRERAKAALDEANRKAQEVNRYIDQNKDLKKTSDECRGKLRVCEVEKLDMQKKPGIKSAFPPPDDLYR